MLLFVFGWGGEACVFAAFLREGLYCGEDMVFDCGVRVCVLAAGKEGVRNVIFFWCLRRCLWDVIFRV